MNSTDREPLLRAGGRQNSRDDWAVGQVKLWAQWAQFVVPSAGSGPVEVEPAEIRHAAAEDPYPQWIYGALVTPENDGRVVSEDTAHIPNAVDAYLPPDILSSVQGIPEDEIRELIIDHVDQQCCWGRTPATKWNMKKVDDCNAFIGVLESFIEEREAFTDVEPYSGQHYTTKEQGRPQGLWEVDMRDEFPLLFTARKEARATIPYTQRVEDCTHCHKKGKVPCPECRGEAGKSTLCQKCQGRGLIAHQDGSDTNCEDCHGTGDAGCSQCESSGLVTCNICAGYGSLLYSEILITRWRTLFNKKLSASSNAATLPDDVLHEASGIQLYTNQAQMCRPVKYDASYGLTKLSADVFATREAIPPTARLIVERHQLRLIPITRVVMSQGDSSYKFYIIGLDRDVYITDYPASCAWCCCLQMCNVQ